MNKKTTLNELRENIKKILSSASKKIRSLDKTEKKISSNNSNGKILKPKDSLIYQLLKRWWYAIEEWPSRDFNPEYIFPFFFIKKKI